jgi:DNA (cytosine-5)-methyltransferase 1
MIYYIDLFCGAGGTSLGVHNARCRQGRPIGTVIACVNHDKNAILSHAANHPYAIHFTEDIRTLNLVALVALVARIRAEDPTAIIVLWASLECTNFSNAKGGKSRDADSRSLADHMPRYIEAIKPDYFKVENVREFMAWGPMIAKPNMKHTWEGHKAPACEMKYDKKKKTWDYHWIPEERTKGEDYQRWLREINAYGYTHEHRLLNAADFGAYTSRLRYFGIFARPDRPIVWPEATHAKKTGKPSKQINLFEKLQPWKPVRDVLDFSDEGQNIFTRKKPYSEKTLERIYAGLIKHVAAGDTSFLSKHYSGDPDSKNIPVSGPAGSMTTTDSHSLVQPSFIVKYMGNDAKTGINNGVSIDEPCLAITTQNRLYLAQAIRANDAFIVQRQNDVPGRDPAGRTKSVEEPARTITTTGGNLELVQANFLQNYYSGGGQTASTDEPSPTIPTKDRVSLVQCKHILDQQYGNSKPASVEEPAGALTENPKFNLIQTDHFISNYYSGGGQNQSVDSPAGALTAIPKARLVSVEPADGFLSNPGWFGNSASVDEPSPTIVASQDKVPVSVVKCDRMLVTNQHNNAARSLDEPAPTILTGNHHYLLNAQFDHILRPTDEVAPMITADRHWPYLVAVSSGDIAIRIYETDSPATIKIKQFMAAYGIVAIKMRMLRIPELKKIQGFPVDYTLIGSQTDQKKFIGNAVHELVPRRWCESLYDANIRYLKYESRDTQRAA